MANFLFKSPLQKQCVFPENLHKHVRATLCDPLILKDLNPSAYEKRVHNLQMLFFESDGQKDGE